MCYEWGETGAYHEKEELSALDFSVVERVIKIIMSLIDNTLNSLLQIFFSVQDYSNNRHQRKGGSIGN
jgi:hypothetical protein